MEAIITRQGLQTLCEIHCENAKKYHNEVQFLDWTSQLTFERNKLSEPKSTMPITSFVYEWMLYNCIYQHNWETLEKDDKAEKWKAEDKDKKTKDIINELIKDKKESSRYKENKDEIDNFLKENSSLRDHNQQRRFLDFIRNASNADHCLLKRAFKPLAFLDDLKGKWTEADPPTGRTKSFFTKLRNLHCYVQEAESDTDIFRSIKHCLEFVYKVRSNIFHGKKDMKIAKDPDALRRIEIYDIFLKCFVSLFFLVVGQKKVASDDMIPSTYIPLLKSRHGACRVDGEELLKLSTRSNVAPLFIKKEDPYLIPMLNYVENDPPSPPDKYPGSALFYPSAGFDVVTPILVGLRHCTDFYFYDKYRYQEKITFSHHRTKLKRYLQRLLGLEIDLTEQPDTCDESETRIYFKFERIPRVIHWVNEDNEDFLKKEVPLTFYFHRGDSSEGGSGQYWDQKRTCQWELAKKVIPTSTCYIVTDGHPGKVHKRLKPHLQEWKCENPPIETVYYHGKLTGEQYRKCVESKFKLS